MKRSSKKLKKQPEPTIRFKFTADRFGFRGNKPLKIDYAGKAVRALGYWAETMTELFGDASAAMEAATNARILPQYPAWNATWRARERAQKWLEASQNAASYAAAVSSMVAPAGDRHANAAAADSNRAGADAAAAQRNADQIVDAAAQDAVEQLRVFLAAIEKWARAFRAGMWAASLGGTGSIEKTPAGRLLQGLKSVAAVYELDMTLAPERIRNEFEPLLPSDPSSESSGSTKPYPSELCTRLEQGRKAVMQSTEVKFAGDPDQLYAWLRDLRAEVASYPHHASTWSASVWDAIEDAYWAQWKWPPIGAVTRLAHTRAVSPLDLIYTTRYGCLPLLHWRGGNLSICQWSRVLNLAAQRHGKTFDAPKAAGLGNLGFGKPTPEQAAQPSFPVIMISPHSEISPVWSWRPVEGTRAFALMPRERDEYDAQASGEARRDASPDRDTSSELIREAVAAARREQLAAAPMHFVEIAGGQEPEKSTNSRLLPWAPWRRIHLGFDGLSGRFQPYVSAPRGLGEIVDWIEEQHREWLPPHYDEQPSLLGRAVEAVRTAVRSMYLEIRRHLATARRLLRIVKRQVALVASPYIRRWTGPGSGLRPKPFGRLPARRLPH